MNHDTFPNPYLPRNIWHKVSSKLNIYGYKPLLINTYNYENMYIINKASSNESIWKYQHLKTWHQIQEAKQNACNLKLNIAVEINDKLYCFLNKNKLFIIDSNNNTRRHIHLHKNINKVLTAINVNNKIHMITISKRFSNLLNNSLYDIKHCIFDETAQTIKTLPLETVNKTVIDYTYQKIMLKVKENDLRSVIYNKSVQ